MMSLFKKGLIFVVCFGFNILVANENIKNFSKLPDIYDIKLSPNGEMIGVHRKVNDELVLSIIDLKSKELIYNHRFVKKGEIGAFQWISNERLLMSKVTTIATRNSRFPTGELYAVNIDGKKSIMLTGRQAKRSSDTVIDDPKQPATVINMLEDDPEHVIVQFYNSDGFWKLYKLNVFDGKMKRFASPPVKQPFYAFEANGDLVAVSGVDPDTFNFKIYLYNKNLPVQYLVGSACPDGNIDCVEVIGKKSGSVSRNENWTYWKTAPWDNLLDLISYDKKSKSLITVENQNHDLSGIYQTNLSNGQRKLIYRHSTVDVGNVLTDDEGKVYAATFMDGYPSTVFFKGENKTKEVIKTFKEYFPNNLVSITSADDEEEKYTVFVSSDQNPGIYYLADFSNGDLSISGLGKYWGSIDYDKLVTMEPFSFQARDGSTIYGYITKSAYGNSYNSPTIVHPHGGPEGIRDSWGFDHRSQMLASEGFNVLQINFRGSGGYGLKYERFIRANWDGVLNDLFDGMEYLHEKGQINKNNACIYGGSYGGYAATQGAIMRPDLFKCSVSDVGVYDLPGLFKTGDIQDSRGGQAQLKIRLGTDEERHKEMSPHYNADKLKVPFFMIHGKNDIRAPYEDAVKFSKKLNKIGFDHKTMFIAKEGHGYSDEGVRYESNMELISFFKKHLD